MNRGPTLCAAGLALLVATSAFAQSARIEVVPAEWAFGQVEEGESFQKTLEVRNRGDAPLIIHRVDPGCGCLSARIFQLEIAPGGAAPLHLALSTTGREGALGKSVILETNDPAQPETRIRVTGLIAKRMWFEIPSLDLGEVPPGSRPSTEVILQVRPGLEAELEDSDFSMEGHEIEAEPFGELEGEHG
ncbi:MAG: DUF1573 domain-containing protein, partial [Planctomycetes bacterium]|nr:DUF1573 domain-containing protein [Planctomycetota bacterium]